MKIKYGLLLVLAWQVHADSPTLPLPQDIQNSCNQIDAAAKLNSCTVIGNVAAQQAVYAPPQPNINASNLEIFDYNKITGSYAIAIPSPGPLINYNNNNFFNSPDNSNSRFLNNIINTTNNQAQTTTSSIVNTTNSDNPVTATTSSDNTNNSNTSNTITITTPTVTTPQGFQ